MDINIELYYSNQKLYEIFKSIKHETIKFNNDKQIGDLIIKLLIINTDFSLRFIMVNPSSRSFNYMDCHECLYSKISEFQIFNNPLEIRIIKVDDEYDRKRNLKVLHEWITKQNNIEYDMFKRIVVKELN